MSRPDVHAHLRSDIVRIAADVQATMSGDPASDFALVASLVAENDVVFSIWPDRTDASGTGLLLIKGHSKLREVIADDMTRGMDLTAIPCIDAEQAFALFQMLGEPDGRH